MRRFNDVDPQRDPNRMPRK